MLVATGGLLLVVMLRIPWLTQVLNKIGFTDFGAVVQTIVVVILVSVFFDVRGIAERTEEKTVLSRHLADPMDVYPLLHERAKNITRPSDKQLDVLGMTLYTAWPSVRFLLNRPELNGWSVRLAALVHGERRLTPYVPKDWFRDSRTHLNSILACGRQAPIRERGIKLEPFGYDFMPAVHGFRLGNGDLFISLLLWQTDGKLGFEGYSYEFIPAEDRSPTAETAREVWDTWFTRAVTTPWSPETVTTASSRTPPGQLQGDP
ncbi:hypothetical protein [Actinophytocola sp.]|uniref:hypothetical protein n=1 Tax=Actinophytocola sp. TaxID=1872138 RepID=UPI00389A74B7